MAASTLHTLPMSTKEPTFFASTTRHLARKLNQQVSRVRDVSGFPSDVLLHEQVDLQFLQHVGFPETADGIAYEPTQGLLAVSSGFQPRPHGPAAVPPLHPILPFKKSPFYLEFSPILLSIFRFPRPMGA